MRIPIPLLLGAVALGSVLAATPASAQGSCLVCDTYRQECKSTDHGALICYITQYSCWAGGQCGPPVGGLTSTESYQLAMTVVSGDGSIVSPRLILASRIIKDCQGNEVKRIYTDAARDRRISEYAEITFRRSERSSDQATLQR